MPGLAGHNLTNLPHLAQGGPTGQSQAQAFGDLGPLTVDPVWPPVRPEPLIRLGKEREPAGLTRRPLIRKPVKRPLIRLGEKVGLAVPDSAMEP